MKIKNKAMFEVEFCGRKHSVETLETVIDAIKIEIEREEPDCHFVLENDKIHYKFKVKNMSNVELHDTMFKDFLDRHTEYVCNSLKINGQHHKACVRDHVLEVEIKELKACQTLMIEFEVKAHGFQSECGRDNDNDKDECDKDKDRHCKCDSERKGNIFHPSAI